jgi:hypothetical protein
MTMTATVADAPLKAIQLLNPRVDKAIAKRRPLNLKNATADVLANGFVI